MLIPDRLPMSFVRIVSKQTCLMLRDQRTDDFIKFIPGDDSLQFVECEIYAVVGNPALWKIICPDPFGPIPGPDLAAAVFRAFIRQFLTFGFIKPRTQDLHGLGAVFVL